MFFKGVYCWLVLGKRSYLGSGVWKGSFKCCLSLPQHVAHCPWLWDTPGNLGGDNSNTSYFLPSAKCMSGTGI